MTTLQDKTNTTGVQSPGNQIQFSRGGIAKKKYRRKSQISSNNENQTAGKTEGENESNAATSVDWWQESKEMMLDWFRCNPLRLGISADSVKFVQGQIELGEKNKNIRSKCWRHIVVEMHGVPGLDEELVRVDHIPAEADGHSISTVLGVKFPNVEIPTMDKLKDVDVETLKRMLVDSSLQKAKLKQRIKVLTKDVETLKSKAKAVKMEVSATNANEETATAPVGSGIAAVKALQRPSSQPSGEDVNNQEQLPQRPLTDRSDVGAVRPYNNNKDEKNKVEATKAKLLPVVKEQEKVVKVNLSKMTMLQRTEHFEKLRKEKLEKKRVEKAEAEKEELQKKKDQLFTKRKQSNSRWSHVRSRLGTQALKTDENNKKNKKKESKSKSLLDDCRSLVGNKSDSTTTTKENNKTTSTTTASKKKSSKTNKENAIKKKVVSKIRSRMSKRKESVKNKRPSLLDMCQGMLEGTNAATKHGLSANEVGKKVKAEDNKKDSKKKTSAELIETTKTNETGNTEKTNDDDDNKNNNIKKEDDAKVKVEENIDEANKKPTPTINLENLDANNAPIAPQNNLTVSPSVPQVTKFFDEQGSNDLKGKFIVQSPTKFAFDSFYRKRDKGTIKPGVTLLMARHEDTAREEPVAIFFNRSKFTEEEASQWWDQNNFRFKISGKKPSEA